MLKKVQLMGERLDIEHPGIVRIIRFVAVGGLATACNLLALYFLTDVLGIWYLVSSAISFMVGVVISFVLQKLWTFQDHSTDRTAVQAGAFFLFAAWNIPLNALLMYILVDVAHFHYLEAQVLVSVVIAIQNFFMYKLVIFKKTV